MKGPCLFREKYRGSINETTYREHIVPLIDGWVRFCQSTTGSSLKRMRDGSRAHSARRTVTTSKKEVSTWKASQAFFPDLNPTETI